MTSVELKQKLDDSNIKVEKRENTMKKLCATIGINFQELQSQLEKEFDYNESYFTYAQAKAILDEYVMYFGDKEEQLIDNIKKYFELKKINKNWLDKYNIQLQKEKAPKNKALVDFLNNWEKMAREWYIENSKYMINEMNKHHDELYTQLLNDNYFKMSWEEKRNYRGQFNRYYDSMNKFLKDNEFISSTTIELTGVGFYKEDKENDDYDSLFGYFSSKGAYKGSLDMNTLDKRLAQEKQRKYEDLVRRISEVVGEIQDASNLSIGDQNGELNGIVKGSKGSAKVQTIGAGGYNIQVFHYRVLVHKI